MEGERASGPQRDLKELQKAKTDGKYLFFINVYLAVISTLFATLCPCGCHRLEDPLHRPRACVVEEEHEADQRQDRSAQLAPCNLPLFCCHFLLLLMHGHAEWGEAKVEVSSSSQDTPRG